jgi:hypothetical protein
MCSNNGILDRTDIIAFKIGIKNLITNGDFTDVDCKFFTDIIQILTDIKNEFTKSKKRTIEEIELDGLHKCSICDEITEDNYPIELSCGHYFCYNCLFKWFVRHDEKTKDDVHYKCPNCRDTLNKNIVIALSLDPKYETERKKIIAEQENEFLDELFHVLQTIFPDATVNIHVE